MFFFPILLASSLTLAHALIPAPNPAPAPAATSPKNVHKALLHVRAFDAEGKLLHSGTAIFINEQGDAVAAYNLLAGASRIEVSDYKGRPCQIHRILGANSTTGLVKFSTKEAKKPEWLSIASTGYTAGASLQLVSDWNEKKAELQPTSVRNVEAFSPFSYYYLSLPNDSACWGKPLLDTNGQLAAFAQRNVSRGDSTSCAIDARFTDELRITATSALNADLRALPIPKALPANVTEAQSFIYMIPATDSLQKVASYNDFIEQHPQMPDGYANRGTWEAACGNYAACEQDFALALEKAASPELPDSFMQADAVHYALSDLIYSTVINQPDTVPVYAGWTITRALQEAETAHKLNPSTLYLVQQGYCLFTDRKYKESSDRFMQAVKDPAFATPEVYFSAAKSLELGEGDSLQVLALMDSVIACIPTPVSARHAQYYIERSQRLIKAGKYRQAVFDYNEYEKAVGPRNLNERFYYLREQAEIEAKMYQQALDDIRTAIAKSAQPLPYRLEEAYLLLRVSEFEQAIQAAQSLLKDLPENPDCYRIMGIAYGETGKKEAALQNLRRALQLGDTEVESFIQKYAH